MSTLMFIFSILSMITSLVLLLISIIQSPSKEQKNLMMLSVCIFILNLGCTMETTNLDANAAIVGIPLSHYGSTHIPLCFLLFFCLMSRYELPNWVKYTSVTGNIFFITMFSTDSSTHFMYKNIEFVKTGLASYPIIEYNTGYFLYSTWLSLHLIVTFVVFYKAARLKRYKYKGTAWILFAFLSMGLLSLAALWINIITPVKYDVRALMVTLASDILFFTIWKGKLYSVTKNVEDDILNNIDDLILAYDANERLIYVNQNMLDYFRFNGEAAYGKPLSEISPLAAKILSLKNDDLFEINKKIYHCEIRSVYNQNQKYGSIHWLKNVTKEQEYIQETIELKEQADKANLAKSKFLAHMSHEIRTPINAIIGMNELILRETNEPQTKEYSNDLLRASKTLLSLINDVLDYSKIEAGKMDIIKAPYNISEMFRDLYNIEHIRADKKGLNLIFNIGSNIPKMLNGDELRIRQILTNLLSNATKYTNKGSVTLTANYINESAKTGNLVVEVKDTGIGISEEDIPKLFAKFERIENAVTHQTEGTGLGMSITIQLLNLMNGTISVKSNEGNGTCFTITIPQDIKSDETIGAWEQQDKNSSNSKPEKRGVHFKATDTKILVVDDNRTNRTVAKLLLKNTGITFDEAASGEEALELIKVNRYDIILMDLRMPGLSGLETLQEMRKIEHANVGVPMVALTADAESRASEYYISEGFDDYMSKPIDPVLYEKMIIKLLPKEKISLEE